MKTVGLLGGLSWISTQDYYRYINEEVNRRLGGLNFAECIIYSLNFADIQRNGWDDWERTFELLAGGCMRLRNAGAQALVLCANTAHALSDRLQSHTGLPIIHIADATSAAISDAGLRERLIKSGCGYFQHTAYAGDIGHRFTARDSVFKVTR